MATLSASEGARVRAHGARTDGFTLAMAIATRKRRNAKAERASGNAQADDDGGDFEQNEVKDMLKDNECPEQWRALNAKKCIECCQKAATHTLRQLEQLGAVMDLLRAASESNIVEDLISVMSGDRREDRLYEKQAEEIIRDSGFDIRELPAVLGGAVMEPPVYRTRPKMAPKIRTTPKGPMAFPLPSSLPDKPQVQQGTAVVYVTPGWSANPVPVLQPMLEAIKLRVKTRVKTMDGCCGCVRKRIFGQDVKRKRYGLIQGRVSKKGTKPVERLDSIMRRTPGGAKP